MNESSKYTLTIGICAKNSEKTIAKAIESINHQSFPHSEMEIIFVDDGSTDKTLKMMQAAAKKSDISTKIFSGPWQGLGKARNTVIFNSEAEYVLWVDSDEIISKNYVKNQVELISKAPTAGIAIGQLGILPDESPVLILDLIPYIIACYHNTWKYPSNLPGTGAALYRLTAAKALGGFNENIRGTGEDIDLAARIVQAGWSIVQGTAVFYETHGKMISWKQLWKKYKNDGFHGRVLYEERKYFSFFRINPLASFFAGVSCSYVALRITRKKSSLLLPFHFFFKMTAWFYGFSQSNQSRR